MASSGGDAELSLGGTLDGNGRVRDNVIATGDGPGTMEAANSAEDIWRQLVKGGVKPRA